MKPKPGGYVRLALDDLAGRGRLLTAAEAQTLGLARVELLRLLDVEAAARDLARLVYPSDVWTPNARPSRTLGPGEQAAKRLNAALDAVERWRA